GMLRGAQEDKKTVLLEAHLDRIGLMVSEITEEGFVKFRTLGGVDERILPASEVYILGKKKCFGVIGALPPHLCGDSKDNEKGVKISDMLIDTGLTRKEAEQAFSVGDPILLKADFCALLDGRVSSAALDNRAGMASVFKCLEIIDSTELDVNVCVAFTVGEELGLQGARTLVDGQKVDFAVVIDVTHAKTADSTHYDTFPLGSGAIICRGPNLHYEATNRIIDMAKNEGIPYEIEVAAGNTGTNAWALQIAGAGIPCALISIPLKFMHTTVETADVQDITNVGRLLAKVIQGGVSLD
ncbi:MAG: M20/M25/M40 family metallo-hydrolase, partial [Clostridia bacterium]|nr:M20/M25/M40 family metallo-hydrolase [Clostridia bacterium]